MIRDGETLEDGARTPFAIVIIGAGAVGLALAMRLGGHVGTIALVEAGDEKFRSSDNLRFFATEQVEDVRHSPGELYRRRMLGGTTSAWGGRCIPFDPEDIQATSDRPDWPISYAELSGYFHDALDLLDAGPAEFLAEALPPRHQFPLNNSADLVVDRLERYSKPTNLWKKWRKSLARSTDVTVIANAACTNIKSTSVGGRATGADLRMRSGRRHTIDAGTVIVACGGLETARLLLASRSIRPAGLGNARDRVGRYYMTHLVSSAANAGFIRFADPSMARAFDFVRTSEGIYARRMLLLSPAIRRREQLPNIVFRPGRPPMDDVSHRNAILSAMFIARRLLIPPEYMRSLGIRLGPHAMRTYGRHAQNIVAGLPTLASFGTKWVTRRLLAARKLPSVFLYQDAGVYPLEFNAEQLPNSESRIRLGKEIDPFDMPRLVVQWRYNDAEVDAICRAYTIFASAVQTKGLGSVSFDADIDTCVRRALVPQGGHHIGTARMSADPAHGVIDANCEVWDTPGLFLAGPAALPTSGFANPTLTAVALALRLADRLIARQQQAGHAPNTLGSWSYQGNSTKSGSNRAEARSP